MGCQIVLDTIVNPRNPDSDFLSQTHMGSTLVKTLVGDDFNPLLKFLPSTFWWGGPFEW